MDLDVPVAADRRRAGAAGARRRRWSPTARDPLAVQTALRRDGADPCTSPPRSPRSSCACAAVAKFGAETPPGCTSPPTGSSRPPGSRSPGTGGPAAAFEARTVVDLGCGIGGDLVALAEAGLTAAGVDLDPVRVAVAEANLAALGLGRRGAASPTPPRSTTPRFDVAFADPARRGPRGRMFDVDDWTPPWSFVDDPARPRRLREGGARHPARAGARRRRGRVGQRPRRGEGGGAVVGPAGHRRGAGPP